MRNTAGTIRSSLLRILALLPVMILLLSSAFASSTSDVFTRKFRWKFEGKWYRMSYHFSWDLYNFYQEKPRSHSNYAVYTYEHPAYRFMEDFTHELACEAEKAGLDSSQTLGFIISFVQQLNYVPEKGEYPKFPVQTLAEKGGDCEDTSILLASILRELNYDVLLINPPGHMAVAVACPECKGTAYKHEGRRYYYIETTGSGFPVGEIPDEYKLTRDKVLSLDVAFRDLRFLAESSAGQNTTSPSWYVREDDVTSAAKVGKEIRLVTNRKLRTVNINGNTYTTTSVTRWMEGKGSEG